MHQTISYAGLSPKDKYKKALRDIQDYVGEERFEHLTKLLREEKLSQEHFISAVSLAGVQGWPAQVWFQHVNKEE
jgi:hypothetical protein